MKRPILIAVIGYIIGIIVGLYLNKSIVLIYIPIIAIYLTYKYLNTHKSGKFKLISIKRYVRYLRIYLNSKVITLLIISSIISNSIIIFQNNKYQKIYNQLSNDKNLNLTGIIISNKEEKQYYNRYKIQTYYNRNKINLYITTNKDIQLKYGEKIIFSGGYTKPEIQRNYRGYDYSKYLKQLKIYGTVNIKKVQIVQENQGNCFFLISNKIATKIITNTKKTLGEESSSILLGVILGYKGDIDEKMKEDFQNASMSHILAISGMHVAYIILGIHLILENKIGKKATYIISICILLVYMFITDFSPSVTRAGIMGIIMVFSKIIYRKNDICTSISISLLIILIYNPFLIQNLGLNLSYGGVIGIVIFNKTMLKILKNINVQNKLYKYKIKEIISVSISVQICILPLIVRNLNIINPYFLISNLILNIFIGPLIILGFIFIIIILINLQVAKIIAKILEIIIQILTFILKISKLPLSKIYIPTLSLYLIIIYYCSIIILFSIYEIYSSKNPNKTQFRIRNLIALGKIKVRNSKGKIRKILIVIVLIIFLINYIQRDLEIYFIDVGQGDSTLIVTPKHKTILIDGGGRDSSDFDVGKNTLLPYILDRGFNKINTVIISHFDNDHIGGIIALLKEIKIEKVYISKQIEQSNNYKEFIEIASKKKIQIYEMKAGKRINIEKNLYFDIIWPTDNQIITNVLNNNAIVCNLHYKKFSMLFTGDIEEIAEREIVNIYSQNENLLKADILKIAHHGSKTSSTSNFLKVVKPKIALIGVGKNNNFGHPNEAVINRLRDLNCKIYRTDLNGEISIRVNNKGEIRVKSKIN